MLSIRVFRAIDDTASCKIFAQEHAKILQEYDITKITSFQSQWFYNPDVYVIIVSKGSEIIAGERIHLANMDYPLPIEQAILQVFKKTYKHKPLINYPKNAVAGELCALWSKKEMEGYGLSVLLTKIGVATAHLLHISRLFLLCSPHTVEMCRYSGCEIDTTIGNEGTFLYPNPDLIATAVVLKDMRMLGNANSNFKRDIFSFIQNPISTITIKGKKGSIEVKYNITIPKPEYILEHVSPQFFLVPMSGYYFLTKLSLSTKLNKKLHVSITNHFFNKYLNEGARDPPYKIYV